MLTQNSSMILDHHTAIENFPNFREQLLQIKLFYSGWFNTIQFQTELKEKFSSKIIADMGAFFRTLLQQIHGFIARLIYYFDRVIYCHF